MPEAFDPGGRRGQFFGNAAAEATPSLAVND
jgi:hypothetical protein